MKLLTETVQWRGVNVEVQFFFTAGSPETGPSHASGGDPATAAEIDTQRAWIVDDDGEHIGFLRADLRREFDQYAYAVLVRSAVDQLAPDPDDARDAMSEADEDLQSLMDRDRG